MRHTFAGLLGAVPVQIKVAKQDSNWFKLLAIRNEKVAGSISVLIIGGYARVEYVRATEGSSETPVRGSRIGTQLYEAAARLACSVYGVPLASGYERSESAESFWFKQMSNGHADEIPHDTYTQDELDEDPNKRDTFYALTCPPPDSLS